MSGSTQVMRPEPLPAFGAVQLAAAGLLARYSGRTREAYALDLRAFFAWCAARDADPFTLIRPQLQLYVRWMEEDRGYPPGDHVPADPHGGRFHRFAVIDGYLHRIQLGALVAAARASTPTDAALVTMLGLLGLGISGACHADIEDPATIDPDLRAGG
jgi:integrase/recombinase XerD